jgi:PIN domain nuclease of toxin-antitoxin system
MRLLLDTNILLALTPRRLATLPARIAEAIQAGENTCFASAASIWEIALKTCLGRLDSGLPLPDLLGFFEAAGMAFLAIDVRHVLADAEPEPQTRDPFDRLLLGQCRVENLRLVTLDRALAAHPLAWR